MNINQTNVMQKMPAFGKARKENVPDRCATVQDLYEAEDRIMAHQQELFDKQNEAIAKALIVIMNQTNTPSTSLKFQQRDAKIALAEICPDVKNF